MPQLDVPVQPAGRGLVGLCSPNRHTEIVNHNVFWLWQSCSPAVPLKYLGLHITGQNVSGAILSDCRLANYPHHTEHETKFLSHENLLLNMIPYSCLDARI